MFAQEIKISRRCQRGQCKFSIDLTHLWLSVPRKKKSRSFEQTFSRFIFSIKLSLVYMNNLIKILFANLWYRKKLFFFLKMKKDYLQKPKEKKEFTKFFSQLQKENFLHFPLFSIIGSRKRQKTEARLYDKLGIAIRHQKFNQKILKTHVNAKLQKTNSKGGKFFRVVWIEIFKTGSRFFLPHPARFCQRRMIKF